MNPPPFPRLLSVTSLRDRFEYSIMGVASDIVKKNSSFVLLWMFCNEPESLLPKSSDPMSNSEETGVNGTLYSLGGGLRLLVSP